MIRSFVLFVILSAASAWASPLPYTAHLRMTSATHGYAVTSSQGEQGVPDRALETQDAGRHWTALPSKAGRMAVLLENGQPAWFLAPQDVCPGPIPENGGPLWSFVDATRGWVMGCADGTSESERRVLWATSDAGVNWKRVASTSPTDKADALPATGHKAGMVFTDGRHGWVFGHDEQGSVYFFATQDAGKTWKRQSLSVPSNTWVGLRTQPDTLHFLSAQEALLSVDMQSNTEEPAANLYGTHDGGQHWKEVGPAPAHHLSFPDARTGFAGEGSKLYGTRDGGKRWALVSPGLGKIDRLQFVNARVGWLWTCGSSLDERCSMLYTEDGGKHWFVFEPDVAEPAGAEAP